MVVRVASATEPLKTFDDKLADVVRTLPGFGGCFIDEEGWLNVYLLNSSQTTPEAVRAALEPLYGRRLPANIHLIKGEYDFFQLKQWADRFFAEVLSLPNVVSTDIDERRNRLVIGISNTALPHDREGLVTELKELIAARQIPQAAVVIEETAPIVMQ